MTLVHVRALLSVERALPQSRPRALLRMYRREIKSSAYARIPKPVSTGVENELFLFLRWLDWIFWGGCLPSLSINYVAMSKDMEKKFPQIYYMKMKISYDLGFIAIGVAMAT